MVVWTAEMMAEKMVTIMVAMLVGQMAVKRVVTMVQLGWKSVLLTASP